tara:strand:- start:365 stop:1753 length:1389 start_codon:yes stop_codon:yes gene_type:complete
MKFLYKNYHKFIISFVLLGIAYHYFNIGTTNIDNFIEISKNKKNIQLKKLEKKESVNKNEEKQYKLIEKEIANIEIIDETLNIIEQKNKLNNEEEQSKDQDKIEQIYVKKGQTFSAILNKQNINKEYIQNIINTTNKIFDLKKLRIDQEINFYYKKNNENEFDFEKLSIPLTFKTEIIVEKINDSFVAKSISLPIITEKQFKNVTITNSLYESGQKFNVPNAILIDLIRLYSFDVDFQRDIQKDDKFIIYYDTFYNEQRREVAYGDITYSNLTLQGKEIEYFLFETSEGFDYFNKEGKNVRKALMKTPLDGARLSSGFGMRKHPILGYDLMHKGVDFAAPKGTPVFAAGNGTIEFAGRNGNYGKYIRIRHNNSYKTAYAHLNGYNKGIVRGARVKQGEIIGFVGSTGRSTGPHLHYEIIFEGKKINPMKMKLPSGKSLKDEELEKFLAHSLKVYSQINEKLN